MALLTMQVAVAGPHEGVSKDSASMSGPPQSMTSGDTSDSQDVDVLHLLGPSQSYNANPYDNLGYHDDGEDEDHHHHGADDAITVASIPEPMTLGTLGIGVLGLGLSRYRRRQ